MTRRRVLLSLILLCVVGLFLLNRSQRTLSVRRTIITKLPSTPQAKLIVTDLDGDGEPELLASLYGDPNERLMLYWIQHHPRVKVIRLRPHSPDLSVYLPEQHPPIPALPVWDEGSKRFGMMQWRNDRMVTEWQKNWQGECWDARLMDLGYDGQSDLLVFSLDARGYSLWWFVISGKRWKLHQRYLLGGYPLDARWESADVDGDHRPDLLILQDECLTILWGDGRPPFSYDVNTLSVLIGDIEDDGRAEILAVQKKPPKVHLNVFGWVEGKWKIKATSPALANAGTPMEDAFLLDIDGRMPKEICWRWTQLTKQKGGEEFLQIFRWHGTQWQPSRHSRPASTQGIGSRPELPITLEGKQFLYGWRHINRRHFTPRLRSRPTWQWEIWRNVSATESILFQLPTGKAALSPSNWHIDAILPGEIEIILNDTAILHETFSGGTRSRLIISQRRRGKWRLATCERRTTKSPCACRSLVVLPTQNRPQVVALWSDGTLESIEVK